MGCNVRANNFYFAIGELLLLKYVYFSALYLLHLVIQRAVTSFPCRFHGITIAKARGESETVRWAALA